MNICLFLLLTLQEADLKKPLKIKYVGGGEQGLDMGGLQKEFFHMIVDAVFNPSKLASDTARTPQVSVPTAYFSGWRYVKRDSSLGSQWLRSQKDLARLW